MEPVQRSLLSCVGSAHNRAKAVCHTVLVAATDLLTTSISHDQELRQALNSGEATNNTALRTNELHASGNGFEVEK